MDAWVTRLESALDRFGHVLLRWWVWPAALVVAGAIAIVLSTVCYPVDNDVHAFGYDLMGPCAFQEQHGQPCASCGMTRSWVWLARGHVVTAFRYNAAGAMLWAMLVGGGIVGLLRLITRRKDLLRWHWAASIGLVTFWVAVYALGWAARLAGFYPLD